MNVSIHIEGPEGEQIGKQLSSLDAKIELAEGQSVSIWTYIKFEGISGPKGDVEFPAEFIGDGCTTSIIYDGRDEDEDYTGYQMRTEGTNAAEAVKQHKDLYQMLMVHTYKVVRGQPKLVTKGWLAALVAFLNKYLTIEPIEFVVQPIEPSTSE